MVPLDPRDYAYSCGTAGPPAAEHLALVHQTHKLDEPEHWLEKPCFSWAREAWVPWGC